MLTRHDTFTLELTANTFEKEFDVCIHQEMSLACLQDMIGSIIEATPQATSFVFTIVRRVSHTEDALN